MNGSKASERCFQFVNAWRQIVKLEPARGVRSLLTNDGTANVEDNAHKRAARLVE